MATISMVSGGRSGVLAGGRELRQGPAGEETHAGEYSNRDRAILQCAARPAYCSSSAFTRAKTWPVPGASGVLTRRVTISVRPSLVAMTVPTSLAG